MHKLLLFTLLAVFFMMLHALQTDEELAVRTLFAGKRSLNAAVHAAAQQIDAVKLAHGVHAIDSVKAQAEAARYLQTNLRLDANYVPLPDTFLRTRVDVKLFMIINENNVFPYTYRNDEYGYSVTLDRPGVIMFIELRYPRIYSVISPIIWTIKSAAEMVYG
jgi:hypothetical protein